MNRFLKSAALLSVLSTTLAASVLAQPVSPNPSAPKPIPGMPMPMPGTTMSMKPGAMAGEEAMMSAMDRMSKDMAAVPMTGDADRDFVGMMLPHHQGAIDMAKFELDHGKDPAMLELARGIVAAQDKEIAEMKAWQAAHPAAR